MLKLTLDLRCKDGSADGSGTSGARSGSRGGAPYGVNGRGHVVGVGRPVADRDTQHVAAAPARPGHPGGALREQPGGHCPVRSSSPNAAHTWVNTTSLRISARGTAALSLVVQPRQGRQIMGRSLGTGWCHRQRSRRRPAPCQHPRLAWLARTPGSWDARGRSSSPYGTVHFRSGVTGPLLVCGNHRQGVMSQAQLHPHPGRQPRAPSKITRAGGAPGSHRPSR